MAFDVVAMQYPEISSVPLGTRACNCINTEDFIALGAGKGGDADIPFKPGAKSFRRRLAPVKLPLVVQFRPEVDLEGNVHTDRHLGLEENIAYVVTNVLAPIDSDPGTRPLIVHLWAGVTLTGDLTIENPGHIEWAEFEPGIYARGVFDVTIAAGYLTRVPGP